MRRVARNRRGRKTRKKYRGHSSRIDARRMRRGALAQIRLRAVTAIRQHSASPEDVAHSLGVCSACVYRWLKKYDECGPAALSGTRKANGRPRILADEEEKRLASLIVTTTPIDHGFVVVLWTRRIICSMVERLFGRVISISTCSRLLRRLGLTKQKPIRRSYRRNDILIEKWKTEVFPKLVERAEELGAEILWLDESTLKSDHASGTTWGEKGVTPVVPAVGRPHSISAIGTISLSGKVDTFCIKGMVDSEVFCKYIDTLMETHAGKLILILDNASFHKSKRTMDHLEKYSGRLELHYLPPYAPELNPVELVWAHTKHHGLNKYAVRNYDEFTYAVDGHLRQLANNIPLCKSFFGKPELAYIKCSATLQEAA